MGRSFWLTNIHKKQLLGKESNLQGVVSPYGFSDSPPPRQGGVFASSTTQQDKSKFLKERSFFPSCLIQM